MPEIKWQGMPPGSRSAAPGAERQRGFADASVALQDDVDGAGGITPVGYVTMMSTVHHDHEIHGGLSTTRALGRQSIRCGGEVAAAFHGHATAYGNTTPLQAHINLSQVTALLAGASLTLNFISRLCPLKLLWSSQSGTMYHLFEPLF